MHHPEPPPTHPPGRGAHPLLVLLPVGLVLTALALRRLATWLSAGPALAHALQGQTPATDPLPDTSVAGEEDPGAALDAPELQGGPLAPHQRPRLPQ